jgi:hypothetical protein
MDSLDIFPACVFVSPLSLLDNGVSSSTRGGFGVSVDRLHSKAEPSPVRY